MFILKVVIYSATFGAALFFAFWEDRLRRQLTDDAPRLPESVIDRGVLDDLKENMGRWQYLKSLPKQATVKYRKVVKIRLLLCALFIVEVIFLQQLK